MDQFDKKKLSEADIRTKYITPAIINAGWDPMTQMREEYAISKGRIVARGKTCKREAPLKADYILFYKPNKPIAVIEAKDSNHAMADGIQQALNYAKMMDIPFVFSSNGDGFVFHNKLISEGNIETVLSNDEFPSPEALWKLYTEQNHISDGQTSAIEEPYYSDNPDKLPRYYQMNAINRTVEAVAGGKNRILLVMATGTGKTYTAFQIIWRLWKSGIKKRILFLADRKALISQTYTGDFSPFGDKMIWVTKQNFDTAHEIYSKGGNYEGYNIGFRLNEILRVNPFFVEVGAVVYDEQTQKEYIKRAISAAYRDYHDNLSNIQDLRYDQKMLLDYELSALRSNLAKLSCFFKRPCFSGEKEIRVVIKVPTEEKFRGQTWSGVKSQKENVKINYRFQQALMIPYIEMPINPHSIESVTIGPITSSKNVALEKNADVVNEFVTNRLGRSVPVSASEIPVRF